MQLRTRTWLVICVLALVGAAVFWRLGEQRLAERATRPRANPGAASSTNPQALHFERVTPDRPLPAGLRQAAATAAAARAAGIPGATAPTATPVSTASTGTPAAKDTSPAALRVRNTTRSIEALARDERALLLRNAVIDTAQGTTLPLPEHLKAGKEAGSYIVQSEGPITPAFRETLTAAGASIVSYLPKNAYLVEATAAQSASLVTRSGVGAVLAFEPYFKLEPSLLQKAVRDAEATAETRLNLTLLPGARDKALATLNQLGADVVAEFKTPFGPAVTVEPASVAIAALARMPEVQGIEPVRERQILNDLTRARLAISQGTNSPGSFTNNLGLTGTNVFVNLNDTGVDASHPDLKGRVTGDVPSTLVDLDGHGTHTAGTIAGSGSMSMTVSNAPGSEVPGADFRGMAPEAEIYAQPIDLITGPLTSDAYLQQTAATNYYVKQKRKGLPISSNSWGYRNVNEYDVSAAGYDAASRDALPELSGVQPILFVFAAGNSGQGNNEGQGGDRNSVSSPGTAKNVITVGAIELPRQITNDVMLPTADGTTVTNKLFLGETDTDYQVTSFSSRGNVQPGIEGIFGRFKPDVVAPGSFVVSTRSKDWKDPGEFTDAFVNRIRRQSVVPGAMNLYAAFVPPDASSFRIRLLPNFQSPDPFPGLPLYVRAGGLPSTANFVNTNNLVTIPPDLPFSSDIWYYGVGNLSAQSVAYDVMTVITVTNDIGNYFEQLKLINDGVGPYYRYESGTSMATPAVTGLLALFQDYFQRADKPTTPALMKALLINGARSTSSAYNFNVRDVINLQGWGLVNLTNTLPATEIGDNTSTNAGHAVQYISQVGSNALVTGQTRSWNLQLTPAAQDQIVKFTLVWTDPPGNPNAAVKLVNDLDLEVKNVTTGETFVGNDMPFGSDFNTAHPTDEPSTNDVVNNVENILIRPPVGTNYVVTVRARGVNVNATTAHPDGIAQDYALVASLNDTSITNAMTFTPVVPAETFNVPFVGFPTNGLPLERQRLGANAPRFGTLAGATNQWRFYVFTNSQVYTPDWIGMTNGAFVQFAVFQRANLSEPRTNKLGADIDLYVSKDPSLTNLAPAAVTGALKSTSSGGYEMVALTNSVIGDVFYLGVKSQDQQSAEFSVSVTSSELPPDEDDANGNRIVRGMPFWIGIPDGSADTPGHRTIIGFVTKPFSVQRVVVTNTFEYDSTGDHLGNLFHQGAYTVLNNHALSPGGGGGIVTSVYDDSNAGDTSYGTTLSRPTDGPGRLTDFIGTEAAGIWLFDVVDNAVGQVATNRFLTLSVHPKPDEEDFFFVTLQAGGTHYYYVDVPSTSTNLTVKIRGVTPTGRSLFVAVRRADPPTLRTYDKAARIGGLDGSVSIGRRDVPPLNPGRYWIGVFNQNEVAVRYGIAVDIGVDQTIQADASYGLNEPVPLIDDAKRFSTIRVDQDLEIVDVKVGVRIDYPRVEDLVLHLTSPSGIRLLLAENRGGPDGTAYGKDTDTQRVFTTFTDNTNLTTTPIKYGVAPFVDSPVPSGASNRVLLSDSFELAPSGTYSEGSTFSPFWVVTKGAVAVTRVQAGSTNIADGEQYLAFAATNSALGTTVQLASNHTYSLKFAYSALGATATNGLSVWVNGARVHTIADVRSTVWTRVSVPITVTVAQNLIEFRSPEEGAGLAIDQVLLEDAEPPLNSYYFPEVPLAPIIGNRAIGDWTLEVTDTRAGPAEATVGNFEWRLEMVYARPGIDAIRLTNGVPYFGDISGTDIRYFYVEVPYCATESINIAAAEIATLVMFGDRDGVPQADLTRFVDDYGPYFNWEPGGIASFLLNTQSPQSAPLVPGSRYYLALRNYQPDLTNNAFGIMVQFDCVDSELPVMPSLTNGIPTQAIIPDGPGLHYYQYIVSSNAIGAKFELTPLSGGNVDLYVRRGIPGDNPLPSPNLYDYASEDPDPAVVDTVEIERISQPMPLVPGVWYVAIRNASTAPVEYTIKVTETYTTLIQLTNSVAFTNTIAATDPVLGLRSSDYQYYSFQVASNSVRATFETLGADGNVNLYVHKGVPIPTPTDYHFASAKSGTQDEFISVLNTDSPVWLSPGWWFLTVENADTTNVTYVIKATETPAFITPLTNNIPFTNVVAATPAPDYYSFQVSPGALSAKFEVFDMSDDVELLLHRGLPVPTLHESTYSSLKPGLTPEVIELTPYSFPVGLTPGDWYLSVLNRGTNAASYVVRASEVVTKVVVLTNGVPQNARLAPGAAVDYYQFTVSTNATAAEFKLTSAGAGDLDLYIHKGPPLPDAANAHYTGATNGPGDELIRIETNSVPVPVSPGVWYLAVTNKEALPVGYEITATEFGVEVPPTSGIVTNIVITTNSVCITWTSIPGTNYFVVARTNALQGTWTPVSPTITATDILTTWCLEPPGPWRFFDVRIGESPVTPIVEPVPVLRFDGTNICVGWSSVSGVKYYVEGKKVFNDAQWTTLTPSITAVADLTEVCYPIVFGYRFFRVGVGEKATPTPTPIPADLVEIDPTVEKVCITWPTKPGLDYLLEGKKTSADPNWTVISEPLRGDGLPLTICLPGNTEYRYFQVIEGVSVPPTAPPSVPVPGVSFSVDSSFQLCLTWQSLLGAEYFVEAKELVSDSFWTVISPILTSSGTELSYCQPLASRWRYFQVRRVNSTPDPAPHIDVIAIVDNQPKLSWAGTAGARYQVFYSDTVPAVWKPVGGAVTSVTTTFTFVDDGIVTAPFGTFRVYRIQRLP